jgi:hypothetical protein
MNTRTKVTLLAATAVIATVALTATTIFAAAGDKMVESNIGTAIKARPLCPSAAEYFEIQKMAVDYDKSPSPQAANSAIAYVNQHCKSKTQINNDWYSLGQRESREIAGHPVALTCASLFGTDPCLWTDLTVFKQDPPVKENQYIVRDDRPKSQPATTMSEAHATSWPITLDANCNVLPSGHSWSELSPAASKKQLDEIREKVALCERTQNGTLPDYREEIRRLDSHAKIDLLVGYRFYALVKYCHEIREGYLSVYINDVEMRRADKAIRAIVQKAVSEDNSIDTDKIWNLLCDKPMISLSHAAIVRCNTIKRS